MLELPYLATGSFLLSDDWQQAPGIMLALHGYGMTARQFADQLQPLVNLTGYALACPEANHHWYHRLSHHGIGASWMTRHRREANIAANANWLDACLAHLVAGSSAPIVVLGFSQGASQAWRLVYEASEVFFAGIIALAGDIPPEHHHAASPPGMPPALLLRGDNDQRYDAQRLQADETVLRQLGWPHDSQSFVGDHAVSDAAITTMAAWLTTVLPST